MKRNIAIAAAVAALSMGTAAWAADDNTANPSNNNTGVTGSVRNEAAKIGIGSADKASEHMTKHAEEIHDVVAQVAEAGMTKSGLDDVVERFVDADRNRLGQNKDALKEDDQIKGRIAQIQKDWKAKYNQDFDIKDEDKVYNMSFASIMEGEEGSAARTAAGVDINANANPNTGTADVNVNNKTGVDKPAVNTNGQTPADTNRNDPGRNVATLHINESHGLPALDVPMIHEAGGWKLDIPDSVDAQKLRDNLKAALTDIGDKKDQWAADVDDAYRFATHRVLLAVFDKQPSATGAGATGALPSGTNAQPTEAAGTTAK
jgi:hypothetical protein